jgi:hypothetical protein
MVYNTQNYWVLGLFPSAGIQENTTFLKLDLFSFTLCNGLSQDSSTYSSVNLVARLLQSPVAQKYCRCE